MDGHRLGHHRGGLGWLRPLGRAGLNGKAQDGLGLGGQLPRHPSGSSGWLGLTIHPDRKAPRRLSLGLVLVRNHGYSNSISGGTLTAAGAAGDQCCQEGQDDGGRKHDAILYHALFLYAGLV